MSTPAVLSSNPILIVGCGGIGGVLGAHLHRRGHALHIATTNEEVRKRWARTGPYLNGKLIRPALPTGKLFDSPRASTGPYELVIVAVQPPQMEAVAQDLRTKLLPSSKVVCLSNGLCEPYLARELGTERVLGAVVAWGARMRRPGHYERTSSGGFLLGALDPTKTPAHELAQAADVLGVMGPVKLSDNLTGARMSKLTINCAISSLGTVGGETLGALLLQGPVRTLALSIMREAVAVARAEGIRLEPIGGIDVEKLVGSDADAWREMATRHAVLLAVGARYRRLRSSMLASMERGRSPAVDYLNGEICRRGQRLGIPTPANDAARAVIWRIFDGQLKAGPRALEEVEALARLGLPTPPSFSRDSPHTSP